MMDTKALKVSPFDKIIITAACEKLPNNLLKQLKINGKMVVPIGKDVQKMTLYKSF